MAATDLLKIVWDFTYFLTFLFQKLISCLLSFFNQVRITRKPQKKKKKNSPQIICKIWEAYRDHMRTTRKFGKVFKDHWSKISQFTKTIPISLVE